MPTREDIITAMCYSFRPDFEYRHSTETLPFGRKPYDPQMKATSLWRSMAKIYDAEIVPYMDLKK